MISKLYILYSLDISHKNRNLNTSYGHVHLEAQLNWRPASQHPSCHWASCPTKNGVEKSASMLSVGSKGSDTTKASKAMVKIWAVMPKLTPTSVFEVGKKRTIKILRQGEGEQNLKRKKRKRRRIWLVSWVVDLCICFCLRLCLSDYPNSLWICFKYSKQSCKENIPQFPIEHPPAQPHNIPTPTPIWGPQAHNWQALWLVEYDSNM